jgi:hypothetical protein
MSAWAPDELERIGRATEAQVAGPAIVGTVVSPEAVRSTLRVAPA